MVKTFNKYFSRLCKLATIEELLLLKNNLPDSKKGVYAFFCKSTFGISISLPEEKNKQFKIGFEIANKIHQAVSRRSATTKFGKQPKREIR